MGSGLSGMYQLVLGQVGGLLKRYGTNAKTSNRMDAHGKHGVSCAVDIYAKLNIKKICVMEILIIMGMLGYYLGGFWIRKK